MSLEKIKAHQANVTTLLKAINFLQQVAYQAGQGQLGTFEMDVATKGYVLKLSTDLGVMAEGFQDDIHQIMKEGVPSNGQNANPQ